MTNECNIYIGYVIYDCMCLMLGAIDMRKKASDEDARVIAAAAEPALSSLRPNILVVADEVSDRTEKAIAAFTVVSKLYSSGCLAEVCKIWITSLPTKDAIKYTGKAFKALIAAFATDGAAMIGVILVELATFPELIEDSITCKDCCYA